MTLPINQIICGDCLSAMASWPENSIDAIVTDPPAGIAFMGKDWDHNRGGRDRWIEWMQARAEECLRVLKPGGHALVWSIPRTAHWTALAWEDAGFEVRDKIYHCFGSGFPKSLDVSKAMDKEAGVKRNLLGFRHNGAGNKPNGHSFDDDNYEWSKSVAVTAPATAAAKQWSGWGTALKPAIEEWHLLRKPLSEPTVAQNVLKWGTGALNIDGCRIGTNPGYKYRADANGTTFHGQQGERIRQTAQKKGSEFIESTKGRWPAHLILSCPEDEYQLRDDVSSDQLRQLAEWMDANS